MTEGESSYAAGSFDAMIALFYSYSNKYVMYSSSGKMFNRAGLDQMICEMSAILSDPEKLANFINPEVPLKTSITRSYGIRAKFTEFARAEYEKQIQARTVVSGPRQA